jgi:dynein intermediate chain 1, axonemal
MESTRIKNSCRMSTGRASIHHPSRQFGELSDVELDKELPPRVLASVDTHAVSNIAVFDFKQQKYCVSDEVPNLIVHYSSGGSLTVNSVVHHSNDATQEAQSGSRPSVVDTSRRGSIFTPNLVRNQFCFHERSCETEPLVRVDCGGGTLRPPCRDWNMLVTKTLIYEKYASSFEETTSTETSPELEAKNIKFEMDAVYSTNMEASCRISERLINLNQDPRMYHDLKFLEQPQYSLVPLFRFVCTRARNKQVTCIKWNPRYSDLFAVSYGSFEFSKQIEGVVAIFSLKNARYPEVVIPTKSTVCALDWHPTKTALLALGFYDGNVGVIDIRKSRSKEFIYRSTARKHFDPIWEVQWLDSGDVESLAFHSVSADGSMFKWTLKKSQLGCEPVVAGGSENCLCFDFGKFGDKAGFLLGTEHGRVVKCSKFYPNESEAVFEGHAMPVYAVKWNGFHSNIFLSASADWSVKVWDQTKPSSPLCAFELVKGAIGDVDWSPIHSTVFATANSEGVVHVFDLAVNRAKEVCSLKILKKGKVTRLKFNHTQDIILAGDDSGNVYCMKLCGTKEEGVEEISKVVTILSTNC